MFQMVLCLQISFPVPKLVVITSGSQMVDLQSCKLCGSWRKNRWRRGKNMKHGSDCMTSGYLLVLSRILSWTWDVVFRPNKYMFYCQCHWLMMVMMKTGSAPFTYTVDMNNDTLWLLIKDRDVVSVSTSRSRDGLETHFLNISVLSRTRNRTSRSRSPEK